MSSSQTMWERMRSGSKAGFDKAWKMADKLGDPVNKLSNKLGSEAFWPTTLDKESDKAARILKSFCKDGFYQEQEFQSQDGPKLKQRVIQKIPQRVIQRCKGLAIFTTMRSGLWISGAGGSGILVAKQPDGSWSPPSGILLHTAGLGFMIGIDIYDCVIVINTEEALDAFTRVRCTVGSEISIAAGPVGVGGILDTELHKRQAAIYTYLKSRGFYAGVQIDGTIILERNDENERFYNQRLTAKEILSGKARYKPYEIEGLMQTLKAAQGDMDVNEQLIPQEAPPGDFEIEDGSAFGVPDKDDPDPYGVLALEKEGMSLKEAGTHKRASWEQFAFHPSPTSPVHNIYARQSEDRARPGSRRSSWRTSAFSGYDSKAASSLRNSMDTTTSRMVDSGTQTGDAVDEPPLSPMLQTLNSASHRSSKGSLANSMHVPMQHVPENDILDTTSSVHNDSPPSYPGRPTGYSTPPGTPPALNDAGDTLEPSKDGASEKPVLRSIQTFHKPMSPQTVATRAQLVTIPKRGPPPKLPPRNPHRSGPLIIGASPKEPVTPIADKTEEEEQEQEQEDLSSPHNPLSPEHNTSENPATLATPSDPLPSSLAATFEEIRLDNESLESSKPTIHLEDHDPSTHSETTTHHAISSPPTAPLSAETKRSTNDDEDFADADADDEDDETPLSDPWAKVEETRRLQQQQQQEDEQEKEENPTEHHAVSTPAHPTNEDEDTRMPGGFDA